MLCFLNNPILESNMVPVPVMTQRRERESARCFLTAVLNSKVAAARAKLVGVSFKAFRDGDCMAIVAKEGGSGGAFVIQDRVLGGFNWEWRISRIDAGGLDNALAGVETRFPGGTLGLIRLRGEQDQLQGEAGVIFLVVIWVVTSVVTAFESMASKVLGYPPWRLHRSRPTGCGFTRGHSWSRCWRGHETGGICPPNIQQVSSCTTVWCEYCCLCCPP